VNAIQPFVFPVTGQQVRTVILDDEPWFVAADVATVLGHSNIRVAVGRLPERMRGVTETDTPGGPQKVQVINEPGVWRLAMRSNLEQAETFQDWLAEEVLPSIRRTGSYSVGGASAPMSVNVTVVNALAEIAYQEHVLPFAGRALAFQRWRKPRKGMQAFVQLTINLGLPGLDGETASARALPAAGAHDA
jgi:prophage antirepressor-like protein